MYIDGKFTKATDSPLGVPDDRSVACGPFY